MKPLIKRALLGYGAFCVVNYAATYFFAKNQTTGTFVDINSKLSKANLLSYILPQSNPLITGTPTNTTQQSFAPLPAPTITDTDSGTTTYYA